MKVVLVGGDPEIRELVRWSLALAGGFLVEECRVEDAPACIARARPDLVLADVVVPELDVELAHRLRQSRDTTAIPVAFLTSCVRADDMAAFAAAGAVAVIVKPFDPRELPGRLRAAVAAEPGRPAVPAASSVIANDVGRDYRTELRARVRAIEEALPGLPALAPLTAQQAAVLAHRLASAAAVFGLDDLSGAARALEDALGRSLIENGESDRRRIKVLVGELRRRADDHLPGRTATADPAIT
jgi:DNA-binding response OmpR family regulator